MMMQQILLIHLYAILLTFNADINFKKTQHTNTLHDIMTFGIVYKTTIWIYHSIFTIRWIWSLLRAISAIAKWRWWIQICGFKMLTYCKLYINICLVLKTNYARTASSQQQPHQHHAKFKSLTCNTIYIYTEPAKKQQSSSSLWRSK